MGLPVDNTEHEAEGGIRLRNENRVATALILCHLAVGCISLVCVALDYPEYHVFFRKEMLPTAVAAIAAFAILAVMFARAQFSFGYFAGYYLFLMIGGYLWLNSFSQFGYNHRLSGLSAATAAAAFLLPALYQPTVPRLLTLSPQAFERLLTLILPFGAAVVAIGACYNFRLVSLEEIYTYRDKLSAPTFVNYLVGITSTSLLPFGFACYALRGNFWRAGAVLVLLLLFYPVTLSKQAFFAPTWLLLMLAMTRYLDLRLTVVLSVLVPAATGLILFALFKYGLFPERFAKPFFQLVNLRMMAVPSLAMDYYNEFFFAHAVTYFCQINFLKPLVPCGYEDQLAVVIYKFFGIGGNMNASLFATEGVASVGPLFAPIPAFVCGVVIAIANGMAVGVAQRTILISGALLPQMLLNVPLTTAMLTYGAAVLFLLWYVMPRDAAERKG